jgi:hypothetical protein
MAFLPIDGLTSIRVVFETHNGAFRAHTVDYLCKDQFDAAAMSNRYLLNQRGFTMEDFQYSIMWSLGASGITGAWVRFEALENTEYAKPELGN